jgi:hypothetical protein
MSPSLEEDAEWLVLPPKKRTRFFTMLSKESGGLCPPNPLGFFALGLLWQGPALGRWAARRRPHLPFARLHRRSSCVPAELYPPLQHRHLRLYRFHCPLLAPTVFYTGTVPGIPTRCVGSGYRSKPRCIRRSHAALGLGWQRLNYLENILF